MIIFLWFVLPLLLLTVADRLWAWSRWLRFKQKKKEQTKEKTEDSISTLNNDQYMRKKIVAGNWKMNLNLQEGVALAKEINLSLIHI